MNRVSVEGEFGGGVERRVYKMAQRNFWGDVYFHYLDYGDGFMGMWWWWFSR